MEQHRRSTGNAPLDATIQGLRLGDNVVWQVDTLADYARFAQAFAARAILDAMPCVYLRFAPHAPLLAPHSNLRVYTVDPGSGFDVFSAQVHRLIEQGGLGVAYVFDNLSTLVQPWATDELLANFFQVMCPYLYQLDTIAYFALLRGSHANDTVAKIAATTQVMIDVYHVGSRTYVHPIKAVGRYSPHMYLPHLVEGGDLVPLFEADHSQAAMEAEPVVASIAPWESVYTQLVQCRERAEPDEAPSREIESLKQELRRMLMGDEPHLSRLADRYLSVDDLIGVRERMIGSGRIGGKAAGMLLARRILLAESATPATTSVEGQPADRVDWATVLEDHDSFYIGSDVFFTFMISNGLFLKRLDAQRQPGLPPEQYAELEARFLAGTLPETIVVRLREMLIHYGEAPIIVRSSSLFEDGFGHAFAGKYRSEFCANQGDLETRLRALLLAVKRVYASALSPDALAYRRRQGLIDSDEQMAILVQRVAGERYKRTYFPLLAGVAFSRNIYPWTERIDPRKGLVRLVLGLGTRAVDRVDDHPRMIALSDPHLRPQTGQEIARYVQRSIDLIDLDANALRSEPLGDVIGNDLPNLHLFVSQVADGYVYDAASSLLEGSFRDRSLVLTFSKFLQQTECAPLLRAMLRTLEDTYGHAIDTEFTLRLGANGRLRLNLLQCRPMTLPGWSQNAVPTQVEPARVLFRANRMAGGGVVRGIGTIVLVDPVVYGALSANSPLRGGVARLIGRLNRHPALCDTKVMMIGPGRWGSSNPLLGVGVTYADIDNTAVLVEMAREEGGYLPEVSFGTHFFQDLVENQIIYLPLYPDDPESAYNAGWVERAPNTLLDLLPEAGEYASLVKVIDVAAASGGLTAQVVADPTARLALCYLHK